MEMKKMFGNLEFGPVKEISMSHLGIALKNTAGNMVSYDRENDQIVDVDLIDFNAENMVYAMPCAIKDIKKGDVIRHVNGNLVFVMDTGDSKDKDKEILVVDVAAGEKKFILPTKSMFGFDFVTKIVSLIDFSTMNASADQPFGNILPLMLLSDNKSSMKDMLPMMMLMNGGNASFGNFDMSNPLVLMALMENGGSESSNFFPMMIAMQLMNGQTVNHTIETQTEKKE